MIAPSNNSWITLNVAAMQTNLESIIALSGGAEVGIVVKSNAYGYGLEQCVSVLRKNACVSWLLVAGTSEALQVRELGWTKNILAMAYHDANMTDVVRAGIVVTLFDLSLVPDIIAAARKIGVRARVHIKIETGMHRLGFDQLQIIAALEVLRNIPEISVEGACTHFYDTGNPDATSIFEQIEKFNTIAARSGILFPSFWHLIASGTLWMPRTYNMIRIGSLFYGVWKSPIHRERLSHMHIRPILSWYTRIMQIKDVRVGDTIGYDATFRATCNMRIAVIPIGYVDGYQRRLSNRGIVMVRGQYAPVVGIISMNLMTIDITRIPEVAVGDCITLIGEHPSITPGSIAQQLVTNPHEITTAIDPRIPRIFIT